MIAFVVIVLALACLAIGWLITGKTKIEGGACGRDPTKKREDDCQSLCSMCSKPIEKEEKDLIDETKNQPNDDNK